MTAAQSGGRRAVARLPEPVQTVRRRLLDRDVLLAGSSLAFYGLISILPLLLLSFSVVGMVTGPDELRRLEDAAVSPQTGSVGLLVRDLIRGSQSTSWIIVVATVWPATAYGAGLIRALRHMSDRGGQSTGSSGRLKGLWFVLVLPALVLLGVPGTYVLVQLPGTGATQTILGWALAAVVGTLTTAVLLLLVYRAFAPERLTWRATARGAFGTAAALAALSLGAIGLLSTGTTSNRYGTPAITAIMLLGVWLFLANIVVLAGYQAILHLQDDPDAHEQPTAQTALERPGDPM